MRYIEPGSRTDFQPASQPRWWTLYLGTLVLVSIYYLNYGTGSLDGESAMGSQLVMPLKFVAITLIVWSLRPFHLRLNASVLSVVALYLFSAVSMLFAIATYGSSNDLLFLNTIIQLPLLFAFTHTQCDMDFGKWLRFIGLCIVIQVPVDVGLWLSGVSLWTSGAFVGGFGNPSSFGLFSTVLFAFYLMHPEAGKARLFMAVVIAIAAVMSKSLFAVLALASVFGLWLMQKRSRMAIGAIAIALILLFKLLAPPEGDNGRITFVEHKLYALGALIGLVEYDIESSASVSLRLQIHTETADGLMDQPQAFLIGHIDGKPYWPMDSQLLTYIGSFGAIMLALFLILHITWLAEAIRNRVRDGGFTAMAFCIFSLIFATNRILDYFPVVTLYFICIGMVVAASRQRISQHQRLLD